MHSYYMKFQINYNNIHCKKYQYSDNDPKLDLLVPLNLVYILCVDENRIKTQPDTSLAQEIITAALGP